jgi:hypothetical protein
MAFRRSGAEWEIGGKLSCGGCPRSAVNPFRYHRSGGSTFADRWGLDIPVGVTVTRVKVPRSGEVEVKEIVEVPNHSLSVQVTASERIIVCVIVIVLIVSGFWPM